MSETIVRTPIPRQTVRLKWNAQNNYGQGPTNFQVGRQTIHRVGSEYIQYKIFNAIFRNIGATTIGTMFNFGWRQNVLAQIIMACIDLSFNTASTIFTSQYEALAISWYGDQQAIGNTTVAQNATINNHFSDDHYYDAEEPYFVDQPFPQNGTFNETFNGTFTANEALQINTVAQMSNIFFDLALGNYAGAFQNFQASSPQIIAWTALYLQSLGLDNPNLVPIVMTAGTLLTILTANKMRQVMLKIAFKLINGAFQKLIKNPIYFVLEKIFVRLPESGNVATLSEEVVKITMFQHLQTKYPNGYIQEQIPILCRDYGGTDLLTRKLETMSDLTKFRRDLIMSTIHPMSQGLILDVRSWLFCAPIENLSFSGLAERKENILNQLSSWRRNKLLKDLKLIGKKSGSGTIPIDSVEEFFKHNTRSFFQYNRLPQRTICQTPIIPTQEEPPILVSTLNTEEFVSRRRSSTRGTEISDLSHISDDMTEVDPDFVPRRRSSIRGTDVANMSDVDDPYVVDDLEPDVIEPAEPDEILLEQPAKSMTNWAISTATGVKNVVISLRSSALGQIILYCLSLVIANQFFGAVTANSPLLRASALGLGTIIQLANTRTGTESLIMGVIGSFVVPNTLTWIGVPFIKVDYLTSILSYQVAEVVTFGQDSQIANSLTTAWRWGSSFLSFFFDNALMSRALDMARKGTEIFSDTKSLCMWVATIVNRYVTKVNIGIFSACLVSIVSGIAGIRQITGDPISKTLYSFGSYFAKTEPIPIIPPTPETTFEAAKKMAEATYQTVVGTFGEKGAFGLGLLAALAILMLSRKLREKNQTKKQAFTGDLCFWEWVALNRWRLECSRDWLQAKLTGESLPQVTFEDLDCLPIASNNARLWLEILESSGLYEATKYWTQNGDIVEIDAWISTQKQEYQFGLRQNLAVQRAELESGLLEILESSRDGKITIE